MKLGSSASTVVVTSEFHVICTHSATCTYLRKILYSVLSLQRRTADVRAVGYAELFVLSREDVLSALADHPDAHVRMHKCFISFQAN